MAAGIVMLVAPAAWAQCTKDTECKGDRVCVDGKCVELAATTSGTPAAVAAPATSATSAAAETPPTAPGIPDPVIGAPVDTGAPGLPGAGALGMSIALPAGGAPTMGASYFVIPTGQIRADFGLATRSEPESQTDYSLEVAWRQYLLGARGRVNPFVQPGVFMNSIDNGDENSTVFAITASAGFEVFLLDRFSVAAATGFAFVTRREPDQDGISTGTSALFANFYW